MPGMDGLALMDLLKAEGHELPTIMITGHGDVPTAVRALKAGAVDFMEKPVRHDALLASIEHAMKPNSGLAALSSWHAAALARIDGMIQR